MTTADAYRVRDNLTSDTRTFNTRLAAVQHIASQITATRTTANTISWQAALRKLNEFSADGRNAGIVVERCNGGKPVADIHVLCTTRAW